MYIMYHLQRRNKSNQIKCTQARSLGFQNHQHELLQNSSNCNHSREQWRLNCNNMILLISNFILVVSLSSVYGSELNSHLIFFLDKAQIHLHRSIYRTTETVAHRITDQYRRFRYMILKLTYCAVSAHTETVDWFSSMQLILKGRCRHFSHFLNSYNMKNRVWILPIRLCYCSESKGVHGRFWIKVSGDTIINSVNSK
jgi:hypothetical protein